MHAELAKPQPWANPDLPDLARLADLAGAPHPGSGPGPMAPPAGAPAQAPQPAREPAAVAPAQAAPHPCGDPGLPALPEPARVADLDAAPQPGSGSGQGHAPAGVPVQAPQPKREPAVVAPAHTPPQELQEEPQAVEREQVMSMPETQSVAASAAQAGPPATQPDTLAPHPHPHPHPYPYPMTNGMPRRRNRRRARSRASWRPMTHDANCQCDACAAQDARWGQHQGQAPADYAYDYIEDGYDEAYDYQRLSYGTGVLASTQGQR